MARRAPRSSISPYVARSLARSRLTTTRNNPLRSTTMRRNTGATRADAAAGVRSHRIDADDAGRIDRRRRQGARRTQRGLNAIYCACVVCQQHRSLSFLVSSVSPSSTTRRSIRRRKRVCCCALAAVGQCDSLCADFATLIRLLLVVKCR